MKYDTLVRWIASKAGVRTEAVRAVLTALPEALCELREDDQVRTPLGVFRRRKNKAHRVRSIADKRKWITVPEEVVIKLRSGQALKPDVD